MSIIYIKSDKNFYRNIQKYKNKKEKVYLNIQDLIIKDDNDIKKDFDEDLIMKVHMINAVNIKNTIERYNYIYDIACNYLDKKFKDNNFCNFKDNKCISVREKSHCKESLNGCCYGTKRGICKNFKNGKCTINSISCKLFTCRYLRKNKIKIKVNDIPILKYFFNNRQKYIIDTSIFKDKDEIINLLLKYK